MDRNKNNLAASLLSRLAAFTLAEVLITLGIIGIVAAMTLPSLVQNYKEKQTVVALKKIYSTMSQAFNSAKSEGIEPEDWATEKTADGYGADEFMSHIKPYLKILKDCNHDKEGCLLTSNTKHSQIQKVMTLLEQKMGIQDLS